MEDPTWMTPVAAVTVRTLPLFAVMARGAKMPVVGAVLADPSSMKPVTVMTAAVVPAGSVRQAVAPKLGE